MDRLLSLHLRGACYVLGALPPTRETRDKIFFEAQQQSINTYLKLETGRWFAKMARITSPLLNVFIPPERICQLVKGSSWIKGFLPPTLFIVIGAHLRTGRPTLTEFFTSLPRVEPWEKNKQ